MRSSLPALFISGEIDGRTPVSNAEEVASGFPNHQHLIVANAAHGIMGYPELTPAVIAFLRGQRIPQSRVSFPEWDLKSGAAFDHNHLRGNKFCVLLAADYRISTRGRGWPPPYSWKETNSSASR